MQRRPGATATQLSIPIPTLAEKLPVRGERLPCPLHHSRLTPTIARAQVTDETLYAKVPLYAWRMRGRLATQVARVAVAPATLVEANSLRLVVGRFDPHDYKTLGVGEPPHPCTNAGKAIKYVLELKNGAGEPVTPPPGFQIRAALHIDGSQTPLTTDEVKWSQRVDGKRAR